MTDEPMAWSTPELRTLSVGMDTAFEGGSGSDGGFVTGKTPS